MESKGTIEGISLNTIKIIGIITMLIDHIGVYFENMISPEIYLIFRIIGRVSMPLFVYSLVQGYIHTSNLKKYILRLWGLSIITQVLIYTLSFLNDNYYTGYTTYITEFLNIVFSFVLTLILIKSIDYSKKYTNIDNKYLNLIFRIITITIIVLVYYFIKIDYSFIVPIIGIDYFLFEKLKVKIKSNNLKFIYTVLELLLMLIILVSYNLFEIFVVFDIIILLLYNEKKKNKIELNRYFTYTFFPIHHSVLYFIAMIIGGKI